MSFLNPPNPDLPEWLKEATKPKAELPNWLKETNETKSMSPPSGVVGEVLRKMGRSLQPATTPVPDRSPVEKLELLISQGEKIIGRDPVNKSEVIAWFRRIRMAVVSLFGARYPLCNSLEEEIARTAKSGVDSAEFRQSIGNLKTLTDHLKALGNSPFACATSRSSLTPSTRDVLVIHGHDETNTLRLEGLLRSEFKLNPVIMRSRPGKTRPLVVKFEELAQTCCFAFALFTPDDEIQKHSSSYSQARPNVIYETGWVIGRLGKERVVLLLKSGTEIHSDLDGVSQIRFTDNVEDKFLEIQRELQAAKVLG